MRNNFNAKNTQIQNVDSDANEKFLSNCTLHSLVRHQIICSKQVALFIQKIERGFST